MNADRVPREEGATRVRTDAARDLEREGAEQPDHDQDMFAETDIEEVTAEEDSRQFLVWDCESGIWRIVDLAQLGIEYELSSYYGYGRPERILRLFTPETPDVAELKNPVVVEPHVVRNHTDEDDYEFTTYELRDESGTAHGQYIVKIDGRV